MPRQVSAHNILLTGLPRSGTTLACRLLNQVPGVVALHEPLPVADYAAWGSTERALEAISAFLAQTRRSLLTRGAAPSRHVGGAIPDNPFSDVPGPDGLRRVVQREGEVRFAKPLQPDFLLVVKHTAAFAALLDRLTDRFCCRALIRNPLAVLLSWQTVNVPIRRGRVPAAEAFDPHLKDALDALDDPLDRQVHILHWFFGRFADTLEPDAVVRYETLVDTGGAALRAVAPAAALLRESLENRNANPLYPKEHVVRLAERLLDAAGPAWIYYARSDVERLAERLVPSGPFRALSVPPAPNRSAGESPCPRSPVASGQGAGPFRVDFLILGAQKCGTTALARFLSEHPDIFLCPSKEAHFFDRPDFPHGAPPEEIARLYHAAFQGWRGQALAGEATPSYLLVPEAPGRIFRYNPRMRLICLVRDPAERAWSQYRMERARGTERRSFLRSVLAERWRFRKRRQDFSSILTDRPVRRFCYLERGLYSRQLARYRARFPPEQILVLRTEDLWTRHDRVLERVYGFLGVPVPRVLPVRRRIFSSANAERPGRLLALGLRLYFLRERIRLGRWTG
jgi:hypothetical protein